MLVLQQRMRSRLLSHTPQAHVWVLFPSPLCYMFLTIISMKILLTLQLYFDIQATHDLFQYLFVEHVNVVLWSAFTSLRLLVCPSIHFSLVMTSSSQLECLCHHSFIPLIPGIYHIVKPGWVHRSSILTREHTITINLPLVLQQQITLIILIGISSLECYNWQLQNIYTM